jgi:choline dehydrogenase-like flavoprotein
VSSGMIYVVGSGPAGVSCAMALLQKRARVTLIDAGLELEPNRTSQLANLRSLGPENWQSPDVAFLKERTSASIKGVPLKYAYGSDFPYRDPGVDWGLEMEGVQTRPSFAKGGLSTVWGAAVLPYRANDIHDWPIEEHELAHHYSAVLDFMPLAGCHDLLEQFFPLHTKRYQSLRRSCQADDFLKDLSSNAEQLRLNGIVFGASRLAVAAQPNHQLAGCCYCGQCMYGCPYEVIYSSSHTLDVLRKHPNFTYQKNVVVDRVAENKENVTLSAHDLSTRQQLQLHGSRVFLACGVLATTKILLESFAAFDQPLILMDSCYFLLPLLRFRATPGASNERLHTLAQAFVEILDPQVCDQTVHLQIYTYNDLYLTALKRLLGPAFQLMQRPTRMLLERLLLVQGYLPSKYSPHIRALLRRDRKSGLSTLHLSPIANELTPSALKRIVGRLNRSRRHLGAIPLSSMLRVSEPGRSFHSGGTFPMCANPSRFQTDKFGRPYGLKRVHAVDATVFPSIPATTITLSVMANAHRIGSGIEDY